MTPVPTLQETTKNSPPRNASKHPARHLNPFRHLPEPKDRHFVESVYKSKFKLKKQIYYEKMISAMIKHFDIPHANKSCFEHAFKTLSARLSHQV